MNRWYFTSLVQNVASMERTPLWPNWSMAWNCVGVWIPIVTTLALALRPRWQGAWKVDGRKYNLGITFTLSGVQESVKEWAHTLPSGLPFWELESQGTPKFLERNLKDQSSLDWEHHYTIGKLLRCKCLKCSCMIQLSTYKLWSKER